MNMKNYKKELLLLNKPNLQLYFIMGTTNVGKRNPLEVLESALKGGITAFQLREKGAGALIGAELKEFALQCKALCAQYKVPFIMNDFVDLALEIDADGVHIGQDDGVIADVREKIGSDKLLGVSTHTVTEALAAVDAGANYIGVGPLYKTDSKADAMPIIGVELLGAIRAQLPGIPLIGIGGISERKIDFVINAGATGVAIISAITAADEVEEATRRLKGQVLISSTGVEI